MNIFLSHPSALKPLAEGICYELQAEGHEVFFDKEDLPAGQSYNEKIRGAIANCDLFVFLITPESVTRGRYTLTELKLVSRKWANPAGRVLPVMIEPTPFDDVPAYLRAVTVLTPEGNVTAEILMEIADLSAALAANAAPPKPDESDQREAPPEDYSYRPVEIRFGKGAAGAYPISLTDSPGGTLNAAPCDLDPAALERQLWSSSERVDGTVRRAGPGSGQDGPSRLPSAADARRVGEQLHALLFSSHLEPCLADSLRSVDPQRREGLRFLINTTDAPDLARLPWEFLYSPSHDDFLFSDRMKPVIRWLDVDQPPPTLAIEPPLRLLTAIASPSQRPDLRVGEEIANLDEALRDLIDDGIVEVTRLDHATLERLDDALLRHQPHVLHFIGHGDFADDEGVIVLEADSPPGAAYPIDGRRLGVLLRNHLGSLRFVFLNSCLGAAASRRDPFGGVAQSLIRRGIPAVIAMQFPIPDKVAVALARHFYRYLAAGLPVDTALTSARAFLYARGYEVEWGAPALHMRTPDGRLFDLRAKTPGNAAPAPAIPPPGVRKEPASPYEAAPEPPPRDPGKLSTERNLERQPSQPRHDTRPASAGSVVLGEPAESRARGGRRWLMLALILMLPALAVVFFAPRSSSPPEAIEVPPPDQPGDPGSALAALALYQRAAAALGVGDSEAAMAFIRDARLKDETGSVLAGLTELRTGLLDGLLDAAGAGLAAAETAHAGELARAALSIDADNERAQEILLLAGKLAAYVGALEAIQTGDSTAALFRLDLARSDDPDGSALAASPSLRDRLFDDLVRAASATAATVGQSELAMGLTGTPPELEALLEAIVALDPERAAEVIAEPEPHPLPLEPTTHPVRRGDTLWTIAAEIYGDPMRWRRIYEANRDRIEDPNLILPGQALTLPPPGPTASPAGTHLVSSGESLWSIADATYGDALLWTTIFDANRERIQDPNLIFPDQQLTIPSQ